MATPEPPPPRCSACGNKIIYPTRQDALREATFQRLKHGHYRDEYRCPAGADGGWHVRDLVKRYEKVKNQRGPEAGELLEKIKRLDLVAPKDADLTPKGRARRGSLENALRKLPTPPKKPLGRRGTFRRSRRHRYQDDQARTRGTRGTAVSNYYRRRTERARLREELLREEKEID